MDLGPGGRGSVADAGLGVDAVLFGAAGQPAWSKEGVAEFWKEIENYRAAMTQSGEFEGKRKKQALAWMWSLIESGLHHLFRSHPDVHAALPVLSKQVGEGSATPGAAAQKLLSFLKG